MGCEFLNQVSEKYADQPIVMVGQPIHTDQDGVLKPYKGTPPLGADESAHGIKEFERVHDLYDIINIKLDKIGSLTEAIKLLCLAKENKMKVMIGCMMCSSLGVAPAMILAQEAELVDLDAPLLSAEDRGFSIQFDHYHALMSLRKLWG